MALADVALAKQLVAILAGLEGPCGALRNQLVAPAEGPPWVRYVLFHGERGIALLDFAPARPSRGIAPLRAFLAEAGFASRYPGELPVVAIELSPETILGVGTLIAEAFAAAPPCTIRDGSWCEAVNRLLMTAEGLTMARVMPAPAAVSPGPLRLLQARQNTVVAGATPVPPLRKSILERPFLQQPIPGRPLPKRAPLQRDLFWKRDRERPLLRKPILEKPILEKALPAQTTPNGPEPGTGVPIEPAKLPQSWISEKCPCPSRAIAGLSVAALAVAALPYLLYSFSPEIQTPTAVSFPTEESAVPLSAVVEAVEPPSHSIPRMAVDVAPPASTIAEPPPIPVNAASAAVLEMIPPTTTAPIQSAAATEGGVAASPRFADVSEAPSISDGTATVLAPTPVRSPAAMERDTKVPSIGTELIASSPAPGKAPGRNRPLRAAARVSPARSADRREPIWQGAPVRVAGRASPQEFVIVARIRDTR